MCFTQNTVTFKHPPYGYAIYVMQLVMYQGLNDTKGFPLMLNSKAKT